VIRALLVLIAGALATAWYFALPPRVPAASPEDSAQTVRGAIHVHTVRSDGTGTVDDVALAASRVGLDFVIFTDHGDGTREPDAPQYRSGVLCIDAVEISTRNGHVLALALPTSPYPLGGEARDVVEDITRLGGLSIASHPGSAKPELRWGDWALPVNGIEWLNADSEWRDESAWTLVRALFTYPARPAEAVAGLLDRPAPVLQRWDDMLRTRRIVAVAGTDAHARIGMRSVGEPYRNEASLHFPSYEQVLRVFSNVLPDVRLTGDASADAALVLDAITVGRVYTRVDGVHAGGTLTFEEKDGTVRASTAGAPAARILLFKDGDEIDANSGQELSVSATAGVYRVEVHVPGAPGDPPVPWMVSNPIYVGRADPPPPSATARPVTATEVQYGDGPVDRWAIETSVASKAAIDVVKLETGTEVGVRYALGGATSSAAFAAVRMTAGNTLPQFDRVTFTARADRPMRISVQLRVPGSTPLGERWQRSVYVDPMPRTITVYFDDVRPAGPTRTEGPPLEGSKRSTRCSSSSIR
jgi:hypothetical protein